MKPHEYLKYMVILIIMAIITIGIIGYAILKKDFSSRMHRIIIGAFIIDTATLILLATIYN